MDPLRSAKRTVTCLRSPSSAAFEVRIFSARCLGVYVAGARRIRAGTIEVWWRGEPRDSPHFRQNLAPSRLGSLQDGQEASSRAPHSSQNAASARCSRPHWRHFMTSTRLL
jgi:hypothetical protein